MVHRVTMVEPVKIHLELSLVIVLALDMKAKPVKMVTTFYFILIQEYWCFLVSFLSIANIRNGIFVSIRILIVLLLSRLHYKVANYYKSGYSDPEAVLSRQ